MPKPRKTSLPTIYYRRNEVDEILKNAKATDDAIAAGLLTPVKHSKRFVVFEPVSVIAVAQDILAGKYPGRKRA